MKLFYYHVTSEKATEIYNKVLRAKEIVNLKEPPSCECETKIEGASGNIVLGTRATYSPYKHLCFPNLRVFKYSKKPVFFAKVVKRPKDFIPEITKEWNLCPTTS